MKKIAFFRKIESISDIIKELKEKEKQIEGQMIENGISQCRVYVQNLKEKDYLFSFWEGTEEEIGKAAEKLKILSGTEARHVYEFKIHEGEDLRGLEARGIIIGVAKGMLDEYIRLHDQQPQIIHDLCYANGFRKSSIFAFPLEADQYYLLQFAEYKGKENPALYENKEYQKWLRVTGACQVPLPGEKFWKEMQQVYRYINA